MDATGLPPSLRTRFAPVRLVGRGGMGRVIACLDLRLKRDVAVKLIEPRVSDREGLVRFAREARILARLSHPRVVRLFDAGEADGIPFLVMELLEGRALAERLADGPLSVREVRDLLDALLDGLGVVHEAGVLHRDVKPSNVVLRPDGTPVLIDFGLARGIDASAMLTGHGDVVGTPVYLPPEVLFGEPATVATDLYSAAATALECLTARPLFRMIPQGTLAQMLDTLRTGAYHPHIAAALEPHGPLGSLLTAALSPVRDDRPITAASFRASLPASPTPTPTLVPPPPLPLPPPPAARPLPPSTRRLLPLTVLALPLLLLAFLSTPRPPIPRASPTPSPSVTSPPPSPSETADSLHHLATRLEQWDPSGDKRRATFELGEHLARTGDQPAVARQARALLATSRLELVRPFQATRPLAGPVQRLYRQLWARHALERVGGPELASRSRVLPLFPYALRPGAVPQPGRSFELDLTRELGLTTDPLIQGLDTIDGSGAFTDTLRWRLRLQGVARARHAWIVVRVKSAPPTDCLRVHVNEHFNVELMTPTLAPGQQFTHSLPVWTLLEGENVFKAKLDSLLARREGMLTGFVRLRVVLSP